LQGFLQFLSRSDLNCHSCPASCPGRAINCGPKANAKNDEEHRGGGLDWPRHCECLAKNSLLADHPESLATGARFGQCKPIRGGAFTLFRQLAREISLAALPARHYVKNQRDAE
jgi:hypothetical protein